MMSILAQCAREPRDDPEADAASRWGPPAPDDVGLDRSTDDGAGA
jgi:hypothetical protein